MRPRVVQAHRRRFDRLLGVALRHLPPDFAHYLHNVAITVADAPSPEQRRTSGLADDEVLFGLYEGIPITERSSAYGSVVPHPITLFRRTFATEGQSEAATIAEITHPLSHSCGP